MQTGDTQTNRVHIQEKKLLHTDVLIIGGGTAGCYAAYSGSTVIARL